MNKLLLIGGTGGIGRTLTPMLEEKYEVKSVGSKVINLKAVSEIEGFLLVYRPDIIVSLVGYNVNAFLHKADTVEIYKQVEVNSIGTANLIKTAAPIMREKQFGRIILASSVLAKHTVIGTSIYSANKAFIESLVRVAAAET
jgi:NADP-dependent 3-hydroxy acid dehydrogenase YdfG